MIRTSNGCKPVFACLTITALLLSSEAFAMRCGNKLISAGDTQAKVLKFCGQPIQKTQRLGLRAGYYRSGVSGQVVTDGYVSRGYYYPYGQTEVLIEDWVFNFGPYQLMRLVTFEDGFVEDIETLEYGYRD